MKVLVIEANAHSPYSLKQTLARHHFNISSVTSHEDAMQMMECFDIDIVILQEKIEGVCGLRMLREARVAGVTTPLIMVSETRSKTNAVDAFAAGADDFIPNHVAEEEFIARIKAVVRRTCGVASSTIQIGKLTIDLNNNCAFAADKPLKLTVKEYELLQALAMRKGRTVTKDSLMSLLYNQDNEPECKIIDVFVCKLRKKLAEALDGENPIDTVWGRGYMMRDISAREIKKATQERTDSKGERDVFSLCPNKTNKRGPSRSMYADVA